MSVIPALIAFIVLIMIMSVLRARLVYELSGASLLIFGSTGIGITLYSLIFLPGTILHELSHWVVAEILQVKTGEITIFPDLVEGGENKRLGSVATARSDPFRGFLIGIAPFLSGLASLIIMGRLLEFGWGSFPLWQLILLIYGIIVVGNSMMISSSDRRTWPFIIFLILFVLIVLYRLRSPLPTSVWSLMSRILNIINQILGVTTGLNLVMIGGLYALRRVIEKLTKRRIV